jgi:cell division protein FtsL
MQFIQKYKTRYLQSRIGKRSNLVVIALENFPGVLFRTAVGITLLGAPFMLNYFSELGVQDLVVRILLNAVVVVIVPAVVLFIYTLIKAPWLRIKNEAAAAKKRTAEDQQVTDMRSLEVKEAREVERLRDVVVTEGLERRRKDVLEEKRWDELNERLRVQEQTGIENDERKSERDALDSAERLSVALRIKSVRDEEEIARQDVASGDMLALRAKDLRETDRREAKDLLDSDRRAAKDLKDDSRWDLLNEGLRAELVSAGKRSDDLLARDAKDLKEDDRRQAKDIKDDDRRTAQDLKDDRRWESLNEGLRVEQLNAGKREEELQARDAKELMQDDRRQAKDIKDDDRRTAQDLKDDRRWDRLNEGIKADKLNAGILSKDLLAREAKDLKEDDRRQAKDLKDDDRRTAQDLKDDRRWDRLTEGLRSEQVKAGKRSDEQRTEREALRDELASGVLAASQEKSEADDERWSELHDRLKVQEAKTEARDRALRLTDDMQRLMRKEDQLQNTLRDHYRTLLERYIRQAEKKGLPEDVADGFAPIPHGWLLQQPEIIRDPTLLEQLEPFNER